MKHLLMTLGLATLGGSFAFGAAASLEVSSQDLGSGFAVVEACDPDGIEVSYNLLEGDPRRVTSITISDIHADCVGQELTSVLYIDGRNGPREITRTGVIEGDEIQFGVGGRSGTLASNITGVSLTVVGDTDVPDEPT